MKGFHYQPKFSPSFFTNNSKLYTYKNGINNVSTYLQRCQQTFFLDSSSYLLCLLHSEQQQNSGDQIWRVLVMFLWQLMAQWLAYPHFQHCSLCLTAMLHNTQQNSGSNTARVAFNKITICIFLNIYKSSVFFKYFLHPYEKSTLIINKALK